MDLTQGPLVIEDLERTLLYLCLYDLRDHEIGERLFISVRTVQRRLERLMALAGAENRFTLGARATKLGWIDPGLPAAPTPKHQ
ncbi:hypothetical protein KZZ52_05450 [Dactylosporangium sp. AC04546]|uniref:hypothetical protein n=1 Tax=Dactylosporangium sp. AC04546 TaxID=2862460 RepID=UPI001EDE489C|nr:hypothetical protein [Dactylosporangium sp. AC04546]WVK84853.1 hypothetical protein KZZ52_05450 [Dactylosporangium sp. AC04546]